MLKCSFIFDAMWCQTVIKSEQGPDLAPKGDRSLLLIRRYSDEGTRLNLQRHCSQTTGETEVSKCMAQWFKTPPSTAVVLETQWQVYGRTHKDTELIPPA